MQIAICLQCSVSSCDSMCGSNMIVQCCTWFNCEINVYADQWWCFIALCAPVGACRCENFLGNDVKDDVRGDGKSSYMTKVFCF